jgi:prolyl oligopeptidase
MRLHTFAVLASMVTTMGASAPALVPVANAQVASMPARTAPQDASHDDSFLWLEEVEAPEALAWVEQRNARTLATLGASPTWGPTFDRILAILESRDRIDYPSMLGESITNFWQDEDHPRGIWRRTTPDSYLSGDPEWETMLDIDALAAEEGVSWSFSGAGCLAPEFRYCLVRLSRGGADAVEVREFDLETLRFVADGFRLPEAKQSIAWIDHNTVLVASDFGPGSMTTSGYTRIAKLWRRGTPLETAETLFEGEAADVSVGVSIRRTADHTLAFVNHSPRFFESAPYLVRDGELTLLDIPMDADFHLIRDRFVVYVRTPWEIGGTTWSTGSLIAIGLDDFLAGNRGFRLILDPGERETINGVYATRDYLLVSMLNNVQSELRRYEISDGDWSYETVPAPEMGSIGSITTSPDHNRYFFSYSGFTQPTTLYLAREDGSTAEVRRMPAMFDAANLVVRQHEAISTDGTSIPYFVVHHADMATDGRNPTLLWAYGGFEVAYTPAYAATRGAAWLERGGVFVLANIRGGGEFGPSWHRAGQKENRQIVFDDFIAVAEDLIDRGVTSPPHLGISGGSNGGILVGAAMNQRPELFNAVVANIPLFDMRRYHLLLAGASWMAEYGNPDVPEEWEYISRYSPYQNLRAGQPYPRVLFTSTTRDDRVHPGHARKAVAKLEALGYPVLYFENTEGGHGAGVTAEQRARMETVTYTYLWEQLRAGSDDPGGTGR